ncbi:Casein kinase II regulatory subunit family protein [Trichomonas vaginalis G3]|uniref:Casein kinase II subunit beta n=1 Tax=Trichomonas vaginalis (strain ATCC PRA-98 / G3) TaxID=412133 RepID=A2EAB9_TRIV3|nr:protein kinase regulator protein [Trichomonas vaginalis G3]EAY10346.1 Casein kinase II regulatory subunit family protein [Trichomonas vaginalis G3]KAI5485371.1 protein kinase regulator protein [Trichomonas vaginalis G3]|eukprot:XP_001322569.1 Casein kinase II regulatory subunit family protein [Trichomonas vaginalis G3]
MSENDMRWIDHILTSDNYKYFVRIDDEFAFNSFNLFGIRKYVTHFPEAYELIRSSVRSSLQNGKIPEEIEKDAIIVYGLLQARFLLTKPGWEQMMSKYREKEFQTCPRVYCKNCVCLPYGVSEEYGVAKMKMFCPNCCDIYNVEDPNLSQIDGAFFGPNWVHMFMQKYPEIVPRESQRVYVPRVFGFRIYHESDAEDDSYADGSDYTD